MSTATATGGTYAGLTLTENYDPYGNRKSQVASGSYGGSVPQPSPVTFAPGNNRVDQWSYDAAGDVIHDGTNMYEYDAEGHQTGTLNSLTGLTGYVYDAEGHRVEKIVVNEYLLGLNDEQVTVLDGSGNWKWTNVYAAGKPLATYDIAGTHFPLTDWLGTRRVELSVTGASAVSSTEQCLSLPYGDGLDCTGTDVNQLHFTGKQRDQESGNDYFGARYYAGNIAGRFLTPDWAAKVEPVPYAKLDNPQSLNLYSYMRDNPLNGTDPDGHIDCTGDNAGGPSGGGCFFAGVGGCGGMGEQCMSFPYGDGLSCTGTDVNQLHFTGKQRDNESTNDYFEARFYGSNVAGRVISPDDGSAQDPGDPQSWNLYSYVWNNPLTFTDEDGHSTTDLGGGCFQTSITATVTTVAGGLTSEVDTQIFCLAQATTNEMFPAFNPAPQAANFLSQAPNNGNPCATTGNAPDPSSYANKGQAASCNAFKDIYNLYNFRRGGALDAQVRAWT